MSDAHTHTKQQPNTPPLRPHCFRRGRERCAPYPQMGDSSHLYTSVSGSETHTPLTSFTTADCTARGPQVHEGSKETLKCGARTSSRPRMPKKEPQIGGQLGLLQGM